MRKIFNLVALLTASIFALSACSSNNHDNYDFSNATPDMESRALALGFESGEDYENSVKIECALGNHENCDVYENSKHKPCQYKEHSGRHHSGKHHNGSDHGMHSSNGKHHHSGGNHNCKF